MKEEGQFYWRFYKVIDPDFNARMQLHEAMRLSTAEQWRAVSRSYGGAGIKTWAHDGSFAGFSFPEGYKPDEKIFKQVGKLYVPKRNTVEGKACWKLIKAVKTIPNVNSVLADYGLEWQVPMAIENGQGMFATVSGSYERGIWFVKVPSRHIHAATLEAMKAVKAETGSADGLNQSALWQPPAAWVQIKHWEFVREYDELLEEAE